MDLTDIKTLTALLDRHGFHFSRSKGQNFLVSPWVPERIAAESGVNSGTGVLEIGPGVGCLTKELSKRAGRVLALELDPRLMPILEETVGGLSNVTVLNLDAMEADLAPLCSEHLPGLAPAVCANLPYNITSPILTKLISSGLFGTITVMIQREVARRICAFPGTADYGAFGIFVGFYTRPRVLFDVPPSCFEPRPAVTSTVIRLDKRATPAADVDESLFFRVVRAAFNQRRKTLLNSLTSGFSGVLGKETIADAIASCDLPASVRGEALGIPEFAALTRKLERRLP